MSGPVFEQHRLPSDAELASGNGGNCALLPAGFRVYPCLNKSLFLEAAGDTLVRVCECVCA